MEDREDQAAGGAEQRPARDPRLEIPEVLRRPVVRPESMREGAGRGRGGGRRGEAGGWSEMAKAWGLAMEFVFSIVGGLLLGWLVDRWAGTGPAFVVVGLAAGFVAAFVRIVRQSARAAGGSGGRRGAKRG